MELSDEARLRLQFSPSILGRLGEELLPHPEQGILELVRNAYDADAHSCSIFLVKTDRPGGSLVVADDGIGMGPGEIGSGWLVLGRSSKSAANRTPLLGRVPVGDKGLGRLAALRLGTTATLTTRPRSEPNTEYAVTLDWREYSKADVVEDVPLLLTRRQTTDPPGTLISIDGLKTKLGRREVQRLARSLLLLADPFGSELGFRPVLVAPDFADLAAVVRDAYFDEAEFHLVAELDDTGRGRATVRDRRGTNRWSAAHADLRDRRDRREYRSPSCTFDFWSFNLNPTDFVPRSPPSDIRQWLDAVGGVHIYHRGLRVQPYGDPGYDWLDMNLARARSPEFRPSTNNSIGRLLVSDPTEMLTQKTDRTGFIDNDAFFELRTFLQDSLNWMALQRLREGERRRLAERQDAPAARVEAEAAVDRVVSALPSPAKREVRAALKSLETAQERESKSLREDLQLYRILATVGTTSAMFAHEVGKPVSQIVQMTKLLESRGKRALGDDYEEVLGNPTRFILRAADALRGYAALPIKLLGRDKRRRTRLDVNSAVEEVVNLFTPLLTDADIELAFIPSTHEPVIRGSVSAVQIVLSNLMTNAIAALTSASADGRPRQVRIWIDVSFDTETLILRFADSGPGIVDIALEEIWLPGRTTRSGGTGLGLAIVRDSVADLGGRVTAISTGELGGAEFLINLPLLDSRQ